MLPNNEGDLHYNQLAESSFKREQELEQEIQLLKNAMEKMHVDYVQLLVGYTLWISIQPRGTLSTTPTRQLVTNFLKSIII
jgi:hypothetical protein